jgi:hypothetical protein
MKIIPSLLIVAEKMLLLFQIDFDNNYHNLLGFLLQSLVITNICFKLSFARKREFFRLFAIYKSVE